MLALGEEIKHLETHAQERGVDSEMAMVWGSYQPCCPHHEMRWGQYAFHLRTDWVKGLGERGWRWGFSRGSDGKALSSKHLLKRG